MKSEHWGLLALGGAIVSGICEFFASREARKEQEANIAAEEAILAQIEATKAEIYALEEKEDEA